VTGIDEVTSTEDADVSIAARPSLLGQTGSAFEPAWVTHADGAHLWSEDGRRFQDFVLGFGSVILGHADPAVTDAVITQVRLGVSPTLRTVRQRELIDLLLEVVPGAEAALLLKSGSDATSAAIRIARAYTGRSGVIRSGYQGWHDWCAPRGLGIPEAYRRLTTVLPFNDLDALILSFAACGNSTAALVVMPADFESLSGDYLHECRRLAEHWGAIFVLDEVRTGFRLSLGGAQEYFGVRADMVTLSKAMANGHSISAVAGRADVMSVARDLSMSSVCFRSTDGIAAAIATIQSLRDSPALEIVWARGQQFLDGISRAIQETGVPARARGLPPMPSHEFLLTGDALDIAERTFYDVALRGGQLLHRDHHWFTCAAMTTDGVAEAVATIRDAYSAVDTALGAASC
jgi:glutamate-1-semialdehyde 2,1-aminomutase